VVLWSGKKHTRYPQALVQLFHGIVFRAVSAHFSRKAKEKKNMLVVGGL